MFLELRIFRFDNSLLSDLGLEIKLAVKEPDNAGKVVSIFVGDLLRTLLDSFKALLLGLLSVHFRIYPLVELCNFEFGVNGEDSSCYCDYLVLLLFECLGVFSEGSEVSLVWIEYEGILISSRYRDSEEKFKGFVIKDPDWGIGDTLPEAKGSFFSRDWWIGRSDCFKDGSVGGKEEEWFLCRLLLFEGISVEFIFSYFC